MRPTMMDVARRGKCRHIPERWPPRMSQTFHPVSLSYGVDCVDVDEVSLLLASSCAASFHCSASISRSLRNTWLRLGACNTHSSRQGSSAFRSLRHACVMSLRSLRRFNCADVAPRSASGHLLREAQIIIESWRHASLGYKPPAPEVFMPAFAAWPAAVRP